MFSEGTGDPGYLYLNTHGGIAFVIAVEVKKEQLLPKILGRSKFRAFQCSNLRTFELSNIGIFNA